MNFYSFASLIACTDRSKHVPPFARSSVRFGNRQRIVLFMARCALFCVTLFVWASSTTSYTKDRLLQYSPNIAEHGCSVKCCLSHGTEKRSARSIEINSRSLFDIPRAVYQISTWSCPILTDSFFTKSRTF